MGFDVYIMWFPVDQASYKPTTCHLSCYYLKESLSCYDIRIRYPSKNQHYEKLHPLKPHCPIIEAQKTIHIQLLCNYPLGITITMQLSP